MLGDTLAVGSYLFERGHVFLCGPAPPQPHERSGGAGRDFFAGRPSAVLRGARAIVSRARVEADGARGQLTKFSEIFESGPETFYSTQK